MQKRHLVLITLLIPISLFVAFDAAAHPYNEPLTFKLHTTKDGRSIYTNIPKKCFSNGVLTCTGVHPLFGTPVDHSKTESKPVKVPVAQEGDSPSDPLPDPPPDAPPVELSEATTVPEYKLDTIKRRCYRRGTASYGQASLFTPHATLQECNEARGNLAQSRSDNRATELLESASEPEFKLSTAKRKCYRRGTADYRQTNLYTPHATLQECNEALSNLTKSWSENRASGSSDSSSGPEFKFDTTKRKCYRRGTANYRQSSLFTPHATLEECNQARSKSSKSRSNNQPTGASEPSNLSTY